MNVQLLKKLLNRTCSSDAPRMSADESKDYPWEMLQEKKYLTPSENQDAIFCPTCHHFADVVWMHIKGRGDVPYGACVECRSYEIDPGLLRTWLVRLETILERVAEQLELRGGVHSHIPNLLWRLGRKKNREYFYIRRFKSDERRILRNELSKMPKAVLITGTDHNLKEIRFDLDNASFSLESMAHLDDECELVIDFEALRDIIGDDDIPDKKSKPKPAPKGGMIAVSIEKLIKELEQFLKDARDHALATAERDDIDLLPRPTKEDLAKRIGVSPATVTRCFAHKSRNANLLNLLWEQANDLKSILR